MRKNFSDGTRWTHIGDDPEDFNYSLDSLTAEVKTGDIVKVENDYTGGGVPGAFYRYTGVTADLDLSDIDYTTGSWQLVTTDINALDGDDFGDDTFWRRDAAITAQATAVSVAASFSGKNALALTGAGAGATNSVLSATNASITRSDVKSAGIVDLDAENTASIDASVISASAALSLAGKNAVGASIGVAIASNLIGYKENGDFDQAQVRAFIENSKVDATGNLTVDAVATQRIDAFVFAGSAAIAGSGQNALGLSGAGVSATNKISMAVEAYIGGDSILSRNDIDAAAVILNASDNSSIIAKAVGASLAGAFAGKNAGALSIAVSLARNTIDNNVAAYIDYADVNAPDGNVELKAEEKTSIDALSVAASLSLAGAGKIAAALSGAGADATNSILTKTNAYIANSTIGTAGTSGANNVILEAENTSSIKATIVGASAAIAGSGKVAAGASIGVALARNLIGWNLDSNNDATVSDPAEVQAYVQNSSINAADDLTLTATSENSIDALVLAFSVAIAGSGNAAVGLTGAGSRSENKLATKTKAFIKGSGASGIVADSVSLSAEDRSKITADVAAASLGIAGSGTISGSVSVGVSLAKNHLSNEIEAYIDSANVTSRTGDITVTANAPENSASFPFDYDNSGTKTLTTGDKVKAGDKVYRFLGEQYQYTSEFGSIKLKTDDIVKVADDFSGNGIAGAFYKAKSSLNNQTVDLGETNYNDGTKWDLISQSLASEDYTNQERWKQDSSISALSIAASLSAGLSGSVGLALSGAGAESTNVILSKTNAYIKDSTISSAGNVDLSAENTASIDATVVAASAAIGASGSIGVGASIGAAVARNLMGWDVDDTHEFDHTSTDVVATLNDGDKVKIVGAAGAGDIYKYVGTALSNADLKLQDFTDSGHWQLVSRGNAVQAFVKNSSINATDDLLLTSLSNQTINSFVLAGSAAVGAAGSVGLAASGAGVSAENRLATEVRSFIDGDGTNGIVADYILLTADDESSIKVDAVGASLAVGAGGSGGGALSIGVSLAFNHISNVVEASISNADNVTTRGGQDWTTAAGLKTVDKGTRVQLAANYAGGGVPGAVYEYVGSAGSKNLGVQNYSDSTLWRRSG